MKSFDVQGIELSVSRNRAFQFIADASHLPQWTNAFASVDAGHGVMRTPGGHVLVGLEVETSSEQGTVDWRMAFPDGSLATAFSRVVEIAPDRCVFSFVLTPPPVSLERVEGTIEAQSRTLAEELRKLKRILEDRA